MPKGAKPGTNNGGGPKTAEGQERAIANLQPSEASVVHGGYAWLRSGVAPWCDQCPARSLCPEYRAGDRCRPMEIAYEGMVVQVMGMPHIEPHHEPLVREYSRHVCGLEIVDRWLALEGLVLPGDEGEQARVHQLLVARDRMSTRMESLANNLLLTPAAAVRSKLSNVVQPLQMMLEVFAEVEQTELARREAEAAATVDGEFELQMEGDEP